MIAGFVAQLVAGKETPVKGKSLTESGVPMNFPSPDNQSN